MNKLFSLYHDKRILSLFSLVTIILSIFLLIIGSLVIKSIDLNIGSNDYFQYIELGKNIFNDFDFTAEHQTGEITIYPPLFPILIHLLTFLIKNSFLAIKWLCLLSLIFSVIPLYLLTESAFNKHIGILTVIFFVFSMGICMSIYKISVHTFLILPTITAAWLTWDILNDRLKKKFYIVLDGFLICLLVLIQTCGIIYLGIVMLLIVFYDIKSSFSMKLTLKKILYLLMGFLPLFLIYNVIVFQTSRNKELHINSIRAFLSGNYHAIMEGKIHKQLFYKLNADATEFEIVEKIGATSIPSYIIRNPKFILHKFYKGLKGIVSNLIFIFNPFYNLGDYLPINTFIPAILIMLVLLAILLSAFRRSVFYILAWLSPSLAMLLIIQKLRHLDPFLAFYTILIIVGGYNLYILTCYNRYFKGSLLILYSIFIIQFILNDISFYNHIPPLKEYEKTALWIKNDAEASKKHIKIMSRKTVFSYLANAKYICTPYEKDWARVKKFALLKKVDYIILDKKYYWGLLDTLQEVNGIQLVYRDLSNPDNEILIYGMEFQKHSNH